MSIEIAKQFLQKAESDSVLKAKLQAGPRGSKEQTLAEVVRIAAAAGFTFTAQHYQAAVNETLSQQHELSETELEKVAGGISMPTLQRGTAQTQAKLVFSNE